MRRFRVTVNGQVYEVEVEEVGAGMPSVPAAAPITPAAAPAPQVPPAPPGPAQIPPAPPRVDADGGAVTAPLPGIILDVKVEPGQRVAAGDVLCILEAMKMENEITAPVAGTVREVRVTKGAAVNLGEVLAVIEAAG